MNHWHNRLLKVLAPVYPSREKTHTTAERLDRLVGWLKPQKFGSWPNVETVAQLEADEVCDHTSPTDGG